MVTIDKIDKSRAYNSKDHTSKPLIHHDPFIIKYNSSINMLNALSIKLRNQSDNRQMDIVQKINQR
jgi:hypothetical protein